MSRTLYYESAAESGNENAVQLAVFQTNDSSPIDLEPYLLPSLLADPNFAAIYAQLQQQVGPTWGDYIATLARDASLLPAVMGDNRDPLTLLDLAVTRATAAVDTSISGVATSPDPLVPIAGQVVDAVNETSGDSYSTYTLNDGSFTFAEVTPGSYSFALEGAILTSAPTPMVVQGQALQGVTLNLVAGAMLAGQITSLQTDVSISNAQVEAEGSAGTFFTTTSGENGNYGFDGLPPDTYIIIADAAGYARSFQTVAVVAAGNMDFSFTMAPEAVIRGNVAPAAGGPVGGQLQVVAQPDGITDPNQTYYGSVIDGSYSIPGLPACAYDLTISLPGYLTGTVNDVVVAAGTTASVGPVDLALAASFDGSIVSTDPNYSDMGELIGLYAGGSLVAETTSDANGDFEFSGLAAGVYTVGLAQPSPLEVDPTVTLVPGASLSGVNISIVPGGRIQGRAINAASGQALVGIEVDLTDDSGNVTPTLSDDQGYFQFGQLRLGTYFVSLPLSGPDSSTTVTVTSLTGPAQLVSLSDSFVSAIQGVVVDAYGNPIAGATVALIQDGQVVDTLLSDQSGAYLFYLVNMGAYQLQASCVNASFSETDGIQVSPGETVNQTITAGTATLTVDLTDNASEAAGDTIQIDLLVDGQSFLSGIATLNGSSSATFGNLVPGTYSIQVSSPSGRGGSTSVDVAAGSSGSAQVSLSQREAVSGIVDDSSDQPLGGVDLQLISTTDPLVAISANFESRRIVFVVRRPRRRVSIGCVSSGLRYACPLRSHGGRRDLGQPKLEPEHHQLDRDGRRSIGTSNRPSFRGRDRLILPRPRGRHDRRGWDVLDQGDARYRVDH